jgi:hypothetical protein
VVALEPPADLFAVSNERVLRGAPVSAAGQGRGRGGDLQITGETVLVAIPRGDEQLRLVHTEGRTGQGKDVAWHALRVFWCDGAGVWRPGKAGVTIRAGELKAVAEALVQAAAGRIRREPSTARTPAPEPRDDSDLDALFGAKS